MRTSPTRTIPIPARWRAAGKAWSRPIAGSRLGWLTTACRRTCSLVTCAAAPSLFYADWVERIPADCPRLSALRELLELPAVSRCVEDARPYRPFFPLGAPDRD